MKKIFAYSIFVLLSLALLFSGKVEAAEILKTHQTSNYPHFEKYLLTVNDLPPCDWRQTPTVTRPVAEGILTYTVFECGEDPGISRVKIFILFAPRIFELGDANYFTTFYDEKLDAPVELGSWSKSMRTTFDKHSLVFTKGNALVYIGPANVEDLAKIIESRLPDKFIPLSLPARKSNEDVTSEIESEFFVEEPQMLFPDGENLLIVSSNEDTHPIHFSVQYTEPHDTYIELCRQGDTEECIKSWHISQSEKLSYDLKHVYMDQMKMFFLVQDRDDFFLSNGDYVFRVWADEYLIREYPFKTEVH